MLRANAGLALLLLGGCLGARPGALVERLKLSGASGTTEMISLEVALLEQPIGERYLNDGLWAEVDEQALDLERKALLESNGLRIGLVGGILPAKFLTLLTVERSNPNPRQYLVPPGDPKQLPLGGTQPTLSLLLYADGNATSAEFAQGQCALQVTPKPEADGTVTLSFVPMVQHGAKAPWTFPIEGGLALYNQRIVERYPALGWDVTLTGSTYLVIGTRYEKVETLGHGCFVSTEGAKPVQRLLVVRASRRAPDAPAPDGADRRSPGVPPLALQAAATIRGTRD